MTALPPISDFTGASVTEAAFKTALSDLRAHLALLLGEDGTQGAALAALGALGSGYAGKSDTYTVTLSDRGKLIAASGSWALSLPPAASAGAGFAFALKNTGSGIITVDPDGAETVDGAATLAVAAGRGAVLVCTGTAWVTVAPPGVLLENAPASVGRLAIGSNTAGTTSDITLTSNAVVGAEQSLTHTMEAGGYWRWMTGATDAATGTAGATQKARLDATGLRLGDAGPPTAPLDVIGNASISGKLDLGGIPIGAASITIADGAVGLVALPTGRYGVSVTIQCQSHVTGVRNVYRFSGWIDAGSSPAITAVSLGVSSTATTGTLTGATGTVGNITIAPNTSQQIQIENRSGSSLTFQVVMI